MSKFANILFTFFCISGFAGGQHPDPLPNLVKVEVTDTSGGVLVDAMVALTLENPEKELRVRTDAYGAAVFQDVPPGSHLLVVSYPGFYAESVSVQLAEDDEAILAIQLQPALADELTITATRLETQVSSLPNTVTIVDQSSIAQQLSLRGDLASVLEMTVPGFGPSLQKMTGRGESLRGRNPLFTINGVPQFNSLRDGQREGHTIDMDFVDRVEVIHGSNAIQGIGATGGVVNLVTKSPYSDGSWTHDAKLTLSSHDSFNEDGFSSKLSYLLGKRFGRFDFVAGSSFHKRDLFFDGRGHPIGLYPTQGDIMDSGARNFYWKSGFDFTSNQRLEFSLNDFQLQRDGDYVVVRGNRSEGRPTTTRPGNPEPVVGFPAENDVTTFSLDYHHLDLFGGEAALQGYYQDYSALFEGGTFGGFFRLTPEGEPFLDQSEIHSQKVGAKFTYRMGRTLAGFRPTLGMDVSRDETAQLLRRSGREWVPETALIEAAPFLQIERSLSDRILVTGGLRLGNARLRVDDFTTIASAGSTPVAGGDPSYTELLPNAGMVFEAGGGLSLHASYSEGYTMPDVGRVLRGISTPGLDVDNLLTVKPVVTDNTEIGMNLSRGGWRVQTSYYRSTSDLGSRLLADPNGFFQVSREETAIDGIDFILEKRFLERFRVGGSYAWIRGEFDSDGDGEVDTDLDGTNIAPNRINLFADARWAKWLNTRFQLSQLFDRDFDGPAAPEVEFDGYLLADLLFVFPTELAVLRLGVQNLFDKQYFTYFSQIEPFARSDTYFAGQGRTLTFVLERRF